MIPTLLSMMHIEYEQRGDKYFFPCPIHDGDNRTGATIFAHDHPNWKCWTNCCHEEHGSSLYSFVKAYLSKTKKRVTKQDVLDFLDGKIELKERLVDLNKLEAINTIKIFANINEEEFLPKSHPKLQIPSPYFLGRGFTEETLKKFKVGDCIDEYSMKDRAVVPIYNKNNIVMGYSGRTLVDDSNKWKNSYGLVKTNHLYGLNFSHDHIVKTGVAIIVEGPANVWRLHQAGYYNYAGIMGAFMSEQQLILLEQAGAMHFIIMTDMDDAGRSAAQSIVKLCGRHITCSIPEYPANDVADLEEEQLNKILEKEILTIW